MRYMTYESVETLDHRNTVTIVGTIHAKTCVTMDFVDRSELTTPSIRSQYNTGESIFRLVGCSGILVPAGMKIRAETLPNP